MAEIWQNKDKTSNEKIEESRRSKDDQKWKVKREKTGRKWGRYDINKAERG